MLLVQAWLGFVLSSCALAVVLRLFLEISSRFCAFYVATQYFFGPILAGIWALLMWGGASLLGLTPWTFLASATLLQAWTRRSWKLLAGWGVLTLLAPLYAMVRSASFEVPAALAMFLLFLLRCRVNLEKRPHSFVLQAKKIDIPGHPTAYNGSLVRWQNRLLLSFRESTARGRISLNYLVWLNEDFSPAGTPQRLPLPPEAEDLRLFTDEDRLYLVYTHAGAWMATGELHFDGQQFMIRSERPLKEFCGKIPGKMEKNWTPFVADQRLILAYSIQPHRILSTAGSLIARTEPQLHWNWGEIRGGTPAVRLDQERYLAFFHSQRMMPSRHSRGASTLHYFIGAYTFSARAPFEVLQVSAEPIVGSGFYKGAKHRLLERTPVNVVYPAGFVMDEQHLWLSYGRQDHEIWIAKLDKKGLLESLAAAS